MVKASNREFLTSPDPSLLGALIYGNDSALVGHNRRILQKSLMGDEQDDTFLLVWMDPDEIRSKSGAISLLSACTQSNLFDSARRVVIIDGANNLHTKNIEAVLKEITPEDAFLLVCAGDLERGSTLLKAFDNHPNLLSLLAEPRTVTKPALEQQFQDLGVPGPDDEAVAHLIQVSRELDWGSFHMLLEKIALYASGTTEPFGMDMLHACNASTGNSKEAKQAQSDALADAVAEGDLEQITILCRRLSEIGSAPVSPMMAVSRHFMMMHRALNGEDAWKLPMHPARKDILRSQLGRWTLEAVESVLQELQTGDLAIRGDSSLPEWNVAERTLMKAAVKR